MFLHQIDLTTALRPYPLPGERILFVQDGVGLYEGKYKIPQYQNGHAYLTTHRACYVDNEDPRRNAVAVDLKDVDHTDFYAGFLKSSAKVTLSPVASKRTPLPRGQSPHTGPGVGRQDSPNRAQPASPVPKTNATWICPICSFSNPIPPSFDPASANSRTYLPPCQACGIKPSLVHIVKAAIAAARQSAIAASPAPPQSAPEASSPAALGSRKSTKIVCPRCTFGNDPQLLQCEICGASLASVADPRLNLTRHDFRAASPSPALVDLSLNDETTASVKFSFRVGGEKAFYFHLKTAREQRAWLLQGAPSLPTPVEAASNGSESSGNSRNPPRGVGIARLEMRGQAQRKNNEMLIGNAFEDLEALMTSAKDIIALAESFSTQAREGNNNSAEADSWLSESASALGLTTTKDMIGSDSLYISELSRNLAEFLTDDTKGVLRKEGGIMSLVDLWAVFNRARNGVELVSPADFEKAARMWEHLKLPLRLRQFKSGLLVVQGRDRTDEKTIAAILAWTKELHTERPTEGMTWDVQKYGRGVTAQEIAVRFGWSMGVASEELEMAEERGALCREQGLDGIKFWENWFMQDMYTL